jgi:hypothetical protein
MPRSFLAPNGVLYHLPALGSGTSVRNAPTHTPLPLTRNNVALPLANGSYNYSQPAAPTPSPHATNMFSQSVPPR